MMMKLSTLGIGLLMFAYRANAQTHPIYYNLPDNVSKTVTERIKDILSKSKGDAYSSQVLLEFGKRNDTTMIWIEKLSRDIPELNTMLANTNRFLKCTLNNIDTSIPILFSADFDWAAPLRKKEVVNNKEAFTTVTISRGGWLVSFVYSRNAAKIITDKGYEH